MRISDWSSDVCSSDLDAAKLFLHRGDHRLHGFDVPKVAGVEDRREIRALQPLRDRLALLLRDVAKGDPGALRGKGFNQAFADPEIGRASWRARVFQYV